MELEEVHNCKKCQGKIVLIGIDKLGVTRCGYCHQVVDYSNYFKLIVAKNRKGQTGRFDIEFDLRTTTFNQVK